MPLVSFVIGGVQKGGTSALAHYLRRNAAVALPAGKEAHVFDDPGFDEAWSADEVDGRYRAHFPESRPAQLHGDATPVYLFQPRLVDRIARYNPAMKWILVLRHPADRAISQFHMERARRTERLPLWLALLLEPLRMRGRDDDLSPDSPLRRHSYLARGRYAGQLDKLFSCFPREQVLLLRSGDLRSNPGECMSRVTAFLGVEPPEADAVYPQVFRGSYGGGRSHRFVRWLLGLYYSRELASLNARHSLRLLPDSSSD